MAAPLPRDLRDMIYLQHGVVTSAQLLQAKLTKDMINSKVTSVAGSESIEASMPRSLVNQADRPCSGLHN